MTHNNMEIIWNRRSSSGSSEIRCQAERNDGKQRGNTKSPGL